MEYKTGSDQDLSEVECFDWFGLLLGVCIYQGIFGNIFRMRMMNIEKNSEFQNANGGSING